VDGKKVGFDGSVDAARRSLDHSERLSNFLCVSASGIGQMDSSVHAMEQS
jgi:hypothetical protein